MFEAVQSPYSIVYSTTPSPNPPVCNGTNKNTIATYVPTPDPADALCGSSPSQAATATPSPNSPTATTAAANALSPGAQAGIAVGVITLAIGAAAVIGFFLYKKRSAKSVIPGQGMELKGKTTSNSNLLTTSTAPKPASRVLERPLPAGWRSGVDEGTGDLYYINEATNQTQWDFPSSKY